MSARYRAAPPAGGSALLVRGTGMFLALDFLSLAWLGKPVWLWIAFVALIVGLLIFDSGVLHRTPHEIGVRESLFLSGFYLALGLAWSVAVFFIYRDLKTGTSLDPDLAVPDAGERAWNAVELYLTGYLLEYALSLDNIFVISLIMGYLAVPRQYQHIVLLWGILGVIVLRGLMIGLGAALISEFAWVLYVFGAFLLFTGVKLLVIKDSAPDIEKNPLLKFLRRNFRITREFHGTRFFVRLPDAKTGRPALHLTPLMVAVCLVEFVDLVFAVDSVPAIFAVTPDAYIVYTSNIFAILGLRSLYFALAAMIHRFHYLKYAIALVLVFIGAKIFLVNLVGKVPPLVSLSVTVSLLVGGVVFSLLKTRRTAAAPSGEARADTAPRQTP
jgi:tellurite resistance protein TerC